VAVSYAINVHQRAHCAAPYSKEANSMTDSTQINLSTAQAMMAINAFTARARAGVKHA